jgi:hypothetical protein
MTVIGDAYSAAEKWQFGLRMIPGALPNDPATVVEALADDVFNWWTQAGTTSLSPVNTHRLTELKVALIGTNGEYVPDTFSVSHFYLPPTAGITAPPAGMTAQNTTAVTLTTAVPRGLASKGRVFLPPNGNMITASDGRIATSSALNLANSFKVLLNGINADTHVGDVVVMSRGRALRGPAKPNGQPTYTYPNPGATNKVTGCSVGRVIDTQRRRRRSLVEANVPSTS